MKMDCLKNVRYTLLITINDTEGKTERRRRRAHQQKKDCKLAMILGFTVITFFILHTPRLGKVVNFQCLPQVYFFLLYLESIDWDF